MPKNKTEPQPFMNDVEHLLAQIEWIKIRTKRIGYGKQIDDYTNGRDVPNGTIGNTKKTKVEELHRRFTDLREKENSTRVEIDARLLQNRESGPAIGLDAICQEHGLGMFERTLLLLSVLPCLGDDITDIFDKSFGVGFCGRYITIDSIWQFMQLSIEERIRSRITLLPESPLIQAGLVTMDVGRSYMPGKIPDSYIELTATAFAVIVGVPALDRPSDNKDGEGDR